MFIALKGVWKTNSENCMRYQWHGVCRSIENYGTGYFRQQIICWEKGYTNYSYPLTSTGLDIQGAQARLILVALLHSGASKSILTSNFQSAALFFGHKINYRSY